MPETKSTLPYAKLWDEDEDEEFISLRMMGAREPIISKDPFPIMEDIFGDLQLEGPQTNIASPEAAKGES